METHGQTGRLFDRVYPDVSQGVVFESDLMRAEAIAAARPTWAVYCAKAPELAIAEGAGAHLEISLLDVSPVGECWPCLDAFFTSERPRARKLAIAVHDGLRQRLRLQGAWHVHSMREAVEAFGNAGVHERYLDVCRWKLEKLAGLQDYRVKSWTGYTLGPSEDLTHFAAVLER
jgi:hypothetical protein